MGLTNDQQTVTDWESNKVTPIENSLRMSDSDPYVVVDGGLRTTL